MLTRRSIFWDLLSHIKLLSYYPVISVLAPTKPNATETECRASETFPSFHFGGRVNFEF